MIRRISLAAALLIGACGDDSSDSKSNEDASTGGTSVGKDAGGVSANDAGTTADPPVTPDVVTNVGEACGSASACMGAKPSCLTTLNLFGQQVPFAGGYCSAQCSDNRECGETGECPVGESLKALGAPLRALLGGAAPSNCYTPCKGNAECRTSEGYRCATIVSALSEGAGGGLNVGGIDVGALLMGPIAEGKYCLPPAPPVPDAGPASGAADAGLGRDN